MPDGWVVIDSEIITYAGCRQTRLTAGEPEPPDTGRHVRDVG